MNSEKNWLKLITLVLITELIGSLSGILSGNIKHIYNTLLIKPPLSPPSFVFGLVWPTLYFLMAIAVYLIYQSSKTLQRRRAIQFYWLQLSINFIWSLIFFRFHLYWFSLATIILLVLLVSLTFHYFHKINKMAGYLILCYLLWILFATYLTLGCAILN